MEAIPCNLALQKYVDDHDTANMIRGNYGDTLENFLCPDAASFSVYDKDFITFNSPDYQEIVFNVRYTKDDGYDWADQTYINKVFSYPYYDGIAYRENGGRLLWSNDRQMYSYYDASGSRPHSITQSINKQAIKVFSCIMFETMGFYNLFGTAFDIFRPGQEDSSFYLPNTSF